ncbi:BZ3500_MvSof-1268-A1-R1_Chr2-1g04608 [Microbotryum saponariae]|uniref:triacylglycerol lipase n=1 Tax=Microbotryum saponariae TaxID=289078 RepID=A0A2X0MC50_9BASI|nr:BZ3500_MvSof-1268-A1-R1_Chr2-1g04608 [Microbotryum saponariae]SCZ92128.1 BZ3501_MvSof-1269-A2-R1_Chr2-1g04264 [Microbotryum saponariae]
MGEIDIECVLKKRERVNETRALDSIRVQATSDTSDEVVPYDSALKTAQSWCRNGAKINFVTEKGFFGGHLGTQISYGSIAYSWLYNQLRGTMAPLTECTFTSEMHLELPIRARAVASVRAESTNRTVERVLG